MASGNMARGNMAKRSREGNVEQRFVNRASGTTILLTGLPGQRFVNRAYGGKHGKLEHGKEERGGYRGGNMAKRNMESRAGLCHPN